MSVPDTPHLGPAPYHTLDACIFCDSNDMSKEHVIADWAYRAFARKRKPANGLRASISTTGRLSVHPGNPVLTAKVVCRACNNEWLSEIDEAACAVLRPVIRGEHEVRLTHEGQTAVAAWLYKSALILDAAENGRSGELASLRAGFATERTAGPGSIIYAGPAGRPPSVMVGDQPQTVNLWMIGIRPTDREMHLTVNVRDADGNVSPGTTRILSIPGYRIMVGALWAYLGGRVAPVDETALAGYSRIWPARAERVTVRAASLVTAEADPPVRDVDGGV
jgi:hypothetical protein